jgi:serine/threonine-protein kinase
MPLVRGRTLKEVLDGLRQQDERMARTYTLTRLVQVFLQVAQAVGYAHAKSVIHRDLKPANVMLGEHGEVQVLDWGLAEVVAPATMAATATIPGAPPGRVVGTPAYMSPEQALGGGVGASTDIYALGVMLYEILTLDVPFRGTARAVLAAVARDEPVPPRAKAPERSIPLELERACRKALAKRAEDRHPAVEELIAEVQSWLEAEADRSKRHERAEEKARDGRDHLEEYRRLKTTVRQLEADAAEVAKQYKDWQPIEEKVAVYEMQERVEQGRDELMRGASRVVTTLNEALGFEPDNREARALLAEYYWDQLGEAERAADRRGRDFFRDLVATYHDGRYGEQLRGDGSLVLDSSPSGATVWLYELEEEKLQLVPRRGRRIGVTPIEPVDLAMGSYLVVLEMTGYRDVRYPVFISRTRKWTGTVNLYREEEIGSGFRFIPAGPFIQGGDEAAAGWSLPRSEPWVSDFFIAEHPVTMGEYLEFLNDLARTDLDAALRCSPRRAPEGGSYLVAVAGVLALPEVDAEGDRWSPRLPAVGVSWHDAVRYCAWRSSREGREYRLATETEWEKAARGVDGRWFPWGNRFDPSLCNVRDSRRGRDAPVSVDECPTDVSVYGVRGMGGNVRDWTASAVSSGEGGDSRAGRVLRGGAWILSRINARCAYRGWYVPTDVRDLVSFRLTCSPGPG